MNQQPPGGQLGTMLPGASAGCGPQETTCGPLSTTVGPQMNPTPGPQCIAWCSKRRVITIGRMPCAPICLNSSVSMIKSDEKKLWTVFNNKVKWMHNYM